LLRRFVGIVFGVEIETHQAIIILESVDASAGKGSGYGCGWQLGFELIAFFLVLFCPKSYDRLLVFFRGKELLDVYVYGVGAVSVWENAA
jgi:hypothetical protein